MGKDTGKNHAYHPSGSREDTIRLPDHNLGRALSASLSSRRMTLLLAVRGSDATTLTPTALNSGLSCVRMASLQRCRSCCCA